MSLKYEHRKAIEQLRREGYAVVVVGPEELLSVRPGEAEDWMIDCVNECLRIRHREKNGGAE